MKCKVSMLNFWYVVYWGIKVTRQYEWTGKSQKQFRQGQTVSEASSKPETEILIRGGTS
jgi:hypothetical protein